MSLHEIDADRELRDRVAEFFQKEVDSRYQMGNLHEIPEISEKKLLEGIGENDIERLKHFFKQVLYPSGEERRKRDRNIESVASIFSNFTSIPMSLGDLVSIVFRYGTTLPSAARTGMLVIKGYRLSLRIEDYVIETIKDRCRDEDIPIDDPMNLSDRLIRTAYAQVPKHDTDRMIQLLKSIVRLGMQRKILDATRDVLKAVKPTRDDAEEQAGIDYLVGVLDEVAEIAFSYSKETIEAFVQIAKMTETRYFEALRRDAETVDKGT